MKKIMSAVLLSGIYTLLSVSPTLCNVAPTSAINSQAKVVLSTNGSINDYSVNWNEKHDRILVESDYAKDIFGADIEISEKTVVLTKNNHSLKFEVGNEFYTMDNLGGRKIGDFTIEDGKAYLPLRYLCEAFGASITYDNTTHTANIQTNAITMQENIKPYFENVAVYDQSTIKITGEKTIYVDPRRITGEPHDADIIFITHTHNDHYEIDSIKRVMCPETKIYITSDGIEQATADGLSNIIGVEPNKDYNADGIEFSTISAYNTATDRQNHKLEYNWVGYIFTINGYTYYSAGDSDFIEEMKNIQKPIDVAFLPIDGKYNMDETEASQAANAIKPKVAVPYHYNNFVTEDKAIKFVNSLDAGIDGAIITFKMQ